MEWYVFPLVGALAFVGIMLAAIVGAVREG
jgi:hypothetical protein